MQKFFYVVSAAAVAFVLSVAPASAMHCPMDMKKIDAAMAEKGASLKADDKKKIMELRAKGEALHKAGKHQESVDTLAQAMKMLGIK